MQATGWPVDRLRDEITALALRGLAREQFFAELAPRVRRVIDNDARSTHTRSC